MRRRRGAAERRQGAAERRADRRGTAAERRRGAAERRADRRGTAAERRQTAADRRQTAADRRQTAAERRQTAAERRRAPRPRRQAPPNRRQASRDRRGRLLGPATHAPAAATSVRKRWRMSNSGGMSESALSPAVSKAVKTLACALCRTKATEEADGTCEGRTREDLRALLVGLSTAWGDKRPTKNQVDAMVGHVLKHVDAQLRLDEQQPPAGAGTATGAGAPPAGKPAPLYQWGTPSNPSEARAFDRSATEKLTSKKTCVAPPLAPHAASPLAPHAANRPAAHPHLLPGGSSEACLFFSLTPTPAVV